MNTPRTDCVMQHGLAMTGKDELVYLARTLEREIAAANDTAVRNKWMCEEMQSQLTAAQTALKLAFNALEVWRFMHPDTTACAVRTPAIVAIKKVLKECWK